VSEYQYYEFQALDRPLTEEQMDELRQISSRAQITPTSFLNVYNYGDFRGSPEKLMEKYFDAFVYLSNWGSRWFMLRIPKTLLDPEIASTYCHGENLALRSKGDYHTLSFQSDQQESEWAEGEGWLSTLVSLRADLIHGDHRCLYLGWLVAVRDGGLDNETLEPPVPPGLAELNAQLESLAKFLHIETDLIAAAAEQSEKRSAWDPSKEEIAGWVARLSPKESESILVKVIEGDDPHIAAEIRQRAVREIRAAREEGKPSPGRDRRTAGQIVARAEMISIERKKREAEQAAQEKARREREEAKKRKKHLESLAGKEKELWDLVNKLIATRQPIRYDEAVSLLKDLLDLSEMKKEKPGFQQRMVALYHEHARKRSLTERFDKAGLLNPMPAPNSK
jgi:hypothetical protein